MQIISHRGRGSTAPDNTVAAFRFALDRRFDGIEIDLRLSSDGQIIVFHDRSLKSGKRVSELSKSQLSEEVGYDVPSLDEVLDLDVSAWWMIELKSPEVLDPLIRELKSRPVLPRITVISFWHGAVARLPGDLPIEIGYSLSHCPTPDFVSRSAAEFMGARADPALLVANHEFLCHKTVEKFRVEGLSIFAFNVQSRRDWEECQLWGVDGVIVDVPAIPEGN